MSDYQTFLDTKLAHIPAVGKEIDKADLHPKLFDFQRDITAWAIRKGRCAIFADTGLGKTLCQVEFCKALGENSLIIAPLSVARQTVRIARDVMDYDVRYVRSQEQITSEHRLWITNYEMIDHFDISQFQIIVLDESSILKALASKTRRKLIDLCQNVKYRLCCSATPAPNDWIELGGTSQFLGYLTEAEMKARFFVNANKEHTFSYGNKVYRKKGSNKGGQEWRLKGHGEGPFLEWLSQWAMCLTKPSDLGYSDEGFDLPPLRIHTDFAQAEHIQSGQLFFTHLKGISSRAQIRRETIPIRLEKLLEVVNGSQEQWIVWCGLNAESKIVAEAFGKDAREVRGNHSPDYKADTFEAFQNGEFRVLITKVKIGGFGLNLQNAHKMAFFGMNDSWEMYYQAVRREYRFMQEHPVDVHIIMSDIEAEIWQNIQRKDAQAARLRDQMIEHIKGYERNELMGIEVKSGEHQTATVRGQNWTAMLGDSNVRLKELDENSIDLSVYSPPFADLYTYTDSVRDLGNSRNWPEFFSHYAFIIREMLRVTKPGRLTCVHTSDIPALAQKDGYIGAKNFPGAVIEAYIAEGWIFHGRAFVQKNPQAQAIRTHSKGLLFVQFDKDSTSSHPCLIDQILIFRKPGENAVPVSPPKNGEADNEIWIEWAHGIWTGIRETDTLQKNRARDVGDEKHICPLQLETIRRCIILYSNPGETVLTPFGGIGSEAYVALQNGRKAIAIELKESYFGILLQNLRKAETDAATPDMFSLFGVEVPEGRMTRAEV